MKNYSFIIVAMISLVFIACNKDGDIIIENPEKPDIDTNPVSLNYRVIEYTPAPGQYINDSQTGFDNISTPQEACIQAEKRLQNGQYVSLGSWGGYIVIKFNEPVTNTGDYEFSIGSNAFDTSNEPGIVWVMQDSNGNALPDDEWYELKGSYFGEPGYERNYWVTYYRPGENEDTPWIDSNGEKGFVKWMGSYHNQPFYYPDWIIEDTFTLYGSRLPSQAEQNTLTGIWINKPFKWGYADNFGEDFVTEGKKNLFKISNAVDEENRSVNLSQIDFIKVQTAINGDSGWLGENSTEVTGFFLND